MKTLRPLLLACVVGIFLVMTGMAQGEGVRKIKTSYKNYSIFTYQDQDILCEPYVVQKNDWLYKIFKKKGEISEKDFPFFISIFKQINPHINNIDAIATGTRILIPLKMTDKQDYTVGKDGRVKIPVVEFHDTDKSSVPRFSVQEYTIVPGDTLSALLDPTFLNKGGGITQEGQTLFYQLNPHIKSIHRIYPGDRIKIPLPSMQDVSTDPVTADTSFATIRSDQMHRLHEYAAAINGKLIHHGNLYFPGRNGYKAVQLDLSSTPLIETDAPGGSILILPRHSRHHLLQDKETRQSISAYWGDVKFLPLETILHHPNGLKPEPAAPVSPLSKKQLFQILTKTGFDYVPEELIRFHINGIPVSARLDRIDIPNRPDLLLNFGAVYGQGIEAIRQQNFDILSFTANQDRQEQIQLLLSALGYNVWHHPSFTYQGTVETLAGIYAEQSSDRLFISSTPVTPIPQLFLEARQIRHVFLEP